MVFICKAPLTECSISQLHFCAQVYTKALGGHGFCHTKFRPNSWHSLHGCTWAFAFGVSQAFFGCHDSQTDFLVLVLVLHWFRTLGWVSCLWTQRRFSHASSSSSRSLGSLLWSLVRSQSHLCKFLLEAQVVVIYPKTDSWGFFGLEGIKSTQSVCRLRSVGCSGQSRVSGSRVSRVLPLETTVLQHLHCSVGDITAVSDSTAWSLNSRHWPIL